MCYINNMNNVEQQFSLEEILTAIDELIATELKDFEIE